MTARCQLADALGDSPLTRFLLGPATAWSGVAHGVTGWCAAHALVLLPSAAVASAIGYGARRRLARWRQERFASGARLVDVLAPPTVAPQGGEVLWAQLSGLQRPWWRRITTGQPHLAFEYAWSHTGLRIRLWVPGTVPLNLVRRAVEAAWPGAHTQVSAPGPPLPAGHVVSGGRLRPARPPALPLRTEHKSDPLRALLQAGTGMGEDEHALVQFLVRPATGIALRRARRAARRLKAGRPAPRLPALAALLAHRPQPSATGKLDPEYGAAVRQSASKLAGPQWQTGITYAATRCPESDGAEQAVRGRAHALASAFGLFADRNWLARTRLPERALAQRAFPRGSAVLSVPELAAMAHLPLDPDAPGLQRAGARSVLPPPSVPVGWGPYRGRHGTYVVRQAKDPRALRGAPRIRRRAGRQRLGAVRRRRRFER
nr:hypothetical protein [Streptomyces armeniacus]